VILGDACDMKNLIRGAKCLKGSRNVACASIYFNIERLAPKAAKQWSMTWYIFSPDLWEEKIKPEHVAMMTWT
jgi:hypothetical protein